MPSPMFPELKRLTRLFLAGLCFGAILLVFWVNASMDALHDRDENIHLPFGVFRLPNGGVYTQDFAYNRLYFQGIAERLVPRPYRLEDQEKLMRRMLPESLSGLSHAYSPVAFILALPLLAVSGAQSYFIYTATSAFGILLLFHFYLLPRTVHPVQLGALALCAFSACLAISFVLGQSALMTTSLLGAFWCLLQRRPADSRLRLDFALAVLFWALCLKPNVAVIPFTLLLGAQAWRALAMSMALLLATWSLLAGYYGGWWTGLTDYEGLLNHYNNADFSPFMQRGHESEAEKFWTLQLFSFDRAIVLISIPVLTFLRWSRRLSASGQFQAAVWIFLLFSPYLLPSEDWILCLLVVEGAFFREEDVFAACAKLLLLATIVDLRFVLPFIDQSHFALKALLAAWILAENCLSAASAKFRTT
jgi:hypothetical protein